MEGSKQYPNKKVGIMTRILCFATGLLLELSFFMILPIWKLVEATGKQWQLAAPPEHGMFATMALNMKDKQKHGEKNGRTH